ncbi:hypothetical protein [Halobacterium salinarum]|uniref:hypothetical protein n=1 Tax=Halobacterium salinarum TaxID=2242 RepID=UPI0030CA2B62
MAENPAATVSLEFSLELETDPLGATLEVAVPDANSDEARQAFLDSAEASLVGQRGNLISQCVAEAHDNLASYASSQGGYDYEPVEASFQGVEVDRGSRSLSVSWSWDSDVAQIWEFGSAGFTIDGSPLLVFAFDSGEYPGLAEAFPGGTAFLESVEHPGFAEARWVRDSLHWLRREVAQT